MTQCHLFGLFHQIGIGKMVVRLSPSTPFAQVSTKPEPPDPHAALTGPDHRPGPGPLPRTYLR